MGKGSGRRNEDAEKVRSNWDAIWSPKKPAETLAEHVFNDKVKEYAHAVDTALIKGNNNDDKK
jgi:hypothetical protein